MKFIIERKKLIKPLQKVNGSINTKPILPILSNILLQVYNDTLILTTTDLEIEIIAKISLNKPYHQGSITVPARKLLDICKSLSDESIILFYVEKEKVILSTKSSKFLLSTLPAINFPNFNEWQKKIEFKIPQSTLKILIESTQFSMANQDARYYLNGMLLETENKTLRTVTTDGHRLSICSFCINTLLINYSVILPRKAINELYRLIDNTNEDLIIQIGSNNIKFNISNFIFTSKLIDGSFPDYKRVLPKKFNKIIEVNSNLLKKSLIRSAILSNERSRGIRLHISNNQMIITANNSEQEEAEEKLDIKYEGSDLEISFNANYILDVLCHIKCDNIRLLFSDSTSSMQIEDTILKSSIYIIMPMKI